MSFIALGGQDCRNKVRERVPGEDTRNPPLDLVTGNLL
jgi:hypothetical protein